MRYIIATVCIILKLMRIGDWMQDWLIQYIEVADYLDWGLVIAVMIANVLAGRFGIWPYSLASFPGTACHELAHWLLAKVFFASPSLPSLWPKRHGDGWIMGSVEFVPTFYNSIPIALAPLLLIPVGIFVTVEVLHEAGGWSYLLYGWIAGNMLYASWPSSQDFRIAAPALGVVALIAAIWWLYA